MIGRSFKSIHNEVQCITLWLEDDSSSLVDCSTRFPNFSRLVHIE